MGVIHRTIHGIRHGYREAILCYQVDTRSCISFKHNKTHTNIFCSDKNGIKVLVKKKSAVAFGVDLVLKHVSGACMSSRFTSFQNSFLILVVI